MRGKSAFEGNNTNSAFFAIAQPKKLGPSLQDSHRSGSINSRLQEDNRSLIAGLRVTNVSDKSAAEPLADTGNSVSHHDVSTFHSSVAGSLVNKDAPPTLAKTEHPPLPHSQVKSSSTLPSLSLSPTYATAVPRQNKQKTNPSFPKSMSANDLDLGASTNPPNLNSKGRSISTSTSHSSHLSSQTKGSSPTDRGSSDDISLTRSSKTLLHPSQKEGRQGYGEIHSSHPTTKAKRFIKNLKNRSKSRSGSSSSVTDSSRDEYEDDKEQKLRISQQSHFSHPQLYPPDSTLHNMPEEKKRSMGLFGKKKWNGEFSSKTYNYSAHTAQGTHMRQSSTAIKNPQNEPKSRPSPNSFTEIPHSGGNTAPLKFDQKIHPEGLFVDHSSSHSSSSSFSLSSDDEVELSIHDRRVDSIWDAHCGKIKEYIKTYPISLEQQKVLVKFGNPEKSNWQTALATLDDKSILILSTLPTSSQSSTQLARHDIRSARTTINVRNGTILLKIENAFGMLFDPESESTSKDEKNSNWDEGIFITIGCFFSKDGCTKQEQQEDLDRFYRYTASILVHANLKSPGLFNKTYTPFTADFEGGKHILIMEGFVAGFVPDIANHSHNPDAAPDDKSVSMARIDSTLLDDTFPACTAAGCAGSPFNTVPWEKYYAMLYKDGTLVLKELVEDTNLPSSDLNPNKPTTIVGKEVYRIPVGHLLSSGIRLVDHSVFDVRNVLYLGDRPFGSEKFEKKLKKMATRFKPNNTTYVPLDQSLHSDLESTSSHSSSTTQVSSDSQTIQNPSSSQVTSVIMATSTFNSTVGKRRASVNKPVTLPSTSVPSLEPSQPQFNIPSTISSPGMKTLLSANSTPPTPTPSVGRHQTTEDLHRTGLAPAFEHVSPESANHQLPKPAPGSYPTIPTQPPTRQCKRPRHEFSPSSSGSTSSYVLLHFGADHSATRRWFAALKSLARLEIFAPSTGDFQSSFRISRSITFRIFEAKLDPYDGPCCGLGTKPDTPLWGTVDNNNPSPLQNKSSLAYPSKVYAANEHHQNLSHGSNSCSVSGFSTSPNQSRPLPVIPPQKYPDTYVEIYFGDRVWSRTSVASSSRIPFWREDYVFKDFPGESFPNFYLVLRQRLAPRSSPSRDPALGYLVLTPKDIRRNGNVEKWYNFIAFAGAPLPMRYYRSSLCLKILYEEFTVGPATVYSTVGKTLETLANTNWSSLVQTDERRDVTQISETCLEICLSGFQIEAAIKWIQSLMTEEIKKIKTIMIERSGDPLFFTRNLQSDTVESEQDAEAIENSKRFADLKRNIDNTLFRGNSILTKSLERYMRIVGSALLEKTVGTFVRQLVADAPDLEVDPSRINPSYISSNSMPNTPSSEVMETVTAHQEDLYNYTSMMWNLIKNSADDIPPGFKQLFSHLATELKKELNQSESSIYNSVAGFLFLRFFCPGILNPKLFGLIRSQRVNKVQRSLTLITKMIQCFANRTRFGFKEPWMIPMNSFFEDHERELFDYFAKVLNVKSVSMERFESDESICSLNSSGNWYEYQPHPLAENFNNPFLIDRIATIPRLIELWKISYCTSEQLQNLSVQRDTLIRLANTATEPVKTKSSSSKSADSSDYSSSLASSSLPTSSEDAHHLISLATDDKFLSVALPHLYPILSAKKAPEGFEVQAIPLEDLILDFSNLCNYIDDVVRRLRVKLEIQQEIFNPNECAIYADHIHLAAKENGQEGVLVRKVGSDCGLDYTYTHKDEQGGSKSQPITNCVNDTNSGKKENEAASQRLEQKVECVKNSIDEKSPLVYLGNDHTLGKMIEPDSSNSISSTAQKPLFNTIREVPKDESDDDDIPIIIGKTVHGSISSSTLVAYDSRDSYPAVQASTSFRNLQISNPVFGQAAKNDVATSASCAPVPATGPQTILYDFSASIALRDTNPSPATTNSEITDLSDYYSVNGDFGDEDTDSSVRRKVSEGQMAHPIPNKILARPMIISNSLVSNGLGSSDVSPKSNYKNVSASTARRSVSSTSLSRSIANSNSTIPMNTPVSNRLPSLRSRSSSRPRSSSKPSNPSPSMATFSLRNRSSSVASVSQLVATIPSSNSATAAAAAAFVARPPSSDFGSSKVPSRPKTPTKSLHSTPSLRPTTPTHRTSKTKSLNWPSEVYSIPQPTIPPVPNMSNGIQNSGSKQKLESSGRSLNGECSTSNSPNTYTSLRKKRPMSMVAGTPNSPTSASHVYTKSVSSNALSSASHSPTAVYLNTSNKTSLQKSNTKPNSDGSSTHAPTYIPVSSTIPHLTLTIPASSSLFSQPPSALSWNQDSPNASNESNSGLSPSSVTPTSASAHSKTKSLASSISSSKTYKHSSSTSHSAYGYQSSPIGGQGSGPRTIIDVGKSGQQSAERIDRVVREKVDTEKGKAAAAAAAASAVRAAAGAKAPQYRPGWI